MQTSPAGSRFHCICNQIKYNTHLPYPQSRNKLVSCLHENFVYIYAGKDGTISLRDFWRFHIGNHTWQQVSFRGDQPSHLEGHTLVSCKKLLLLFGGEFGDALTESSLWIINPDLDYIRKCNLDPGSERPSVRRHHSAVVYRGCMFVYGGYVDMQGSSSEFWQYRIDDEEWDLLLPRRSSHCGPGGLHGHTAVIFNKYMWVYGGMSNLIPKQELWCYNFISSQWDRVKYKYGPPALTGHSAVVVDSQMFLFGGECNREPVNQLWCFCFRTELWTQVQCHQHIPSARMFHSAVVVSQVSKSEDTVKASSMPYLQNTLKHLKLERPRTSPQSKSQESLHFSDEHFRNKNTNSRPQVLNLRENSDSCESLKIVPSPAENTKDHSPLVPKKVDLNYNILDKSNVRNGLDNPGISKSTEELIRENQNLRLLKLNQDTEEFDNKIPFLRSQSESFSSLCGEITCKQDQLLNPYLRQVSSGFNYSEVASSDNLVYDIRAKKFRPDPDLILEDLEYKDCFPNDIKIHYPTSKSALKANNILYSSNSMLSTEQLESIELADLKAGKETNLCYGHKIDLCDKRRNHRSDYPYSTHEQHTSFVSQKDGKLRELSVNYSQNTTAYNRCSNIQSASKDTQMELESVGDTHNCESMPRPGNCDTSFISGSLQGSINNSSCGGQTNNRNSKQIDQNTEPYMLVFGGKEKQIANFGIKPLAVWNFRLKKL